MVCPYCGGKTQVFNSRSQKRTNSKWRRRKCLECSSLFTTEESYELSTVLRVKTHTGKLQPFSTAKLMISVYECCKHLKHPEKSAQALTETICKDLLDLQKPVIKPKEIASVAHYAIKRLDSAAAVQYSAFHN